MKIDDLYLSVAGFNIKITFQKTYPPFFPEKSMRKKLALYYKGVLILKKPAKLDFILEITQKKEFEVIIKINEKKHFINFYEEVSKQKIRTFYHLSAVHVQLITRKILQILLVKNKGMILHSSAVLINREACLFMGKSGEGKSTSMKILSSKYTPLADDSVIIKRESSKYFFYQTPAHEKNSWFSKASLRYKIDKICFIRKKSNYQLTKIHDKSLILKKMIQQLFTEQEDQQSQVKNLIKFISGFDEFYFLDFAIDRPEKVIELFNHE